MMSLALVVLALAGLYGGLTALNLGLFHAPGPAPAGARAAVSLLIPARDEAERIEATLAAALASQGVELEIVVLDDGSTDDTAARVARIAERDTRLRLIPGSALPAGHNGKQHACAQLAAAARHDVLVFIDADVHLEPQALARATAWMDEHELGLASGFPEETTQSLGEMLLVPMIPVLLLGYLPLAMSRMMPRAPSLAAGCGQLMGVRRVAYAAAGGHAAIATRMHDGLNLPANVRRAGHKTDLFNAAGLARCRMYDGFRSAWHGFSKDATEGMAKPVALPVWSILLAGGHIAPGLLLVITAGLGQWDVAGVALLATGLVVGARVAVARRTRQRPLAVLLHPIAVAATLALQWQALVAARRGRARSWRGRTYAP